MKKIILTIFAAVLVASSPAWAGGGHGHDKHRDKHAEKQWKKEHKHWAKHRGDDGDSENRGHRRFRDYDRHVAHNYYASPQRVIEQHHYYYAAPRVYSSPPAINLALPGVYVPF